MPQPASETPASEFHRGDMLAEKFRLLEPIGTGAMGEVWSAKHVTLKHEVAIKLLHASVVHDAESRSRFELEAKLAAKLGELSRHITRVIDYGVTREGVPYLVMELLRGEGLEVKLKRMRRLPIEEVAFITTQLCKALHVAHQNGVLHRDLKPANIFLCREGHEICVKLLDFGVAKALFDLDDNPTTRVGSLIGTPNYMSPEQITGEGELDFRSDLFAAAAIVYRMAVGKAPFGSGSLSELAMRIVSADPPQPTKLAPDLPEAMDSWVKRALAKKPEDRFQSARELATSVSSLAGIPTQAANEAFQAPHERQEDKNAQTTESSLALQHTIQTTRPPPPHQDKKTSRRTLWIASLSVVFFGGITGISIKWLIPQWFPTQRQSVPMTIPPSAPLTEATAASSTPLAGNESQQGLTSNVPSADSLPLVPVPSVVPSVPVSTSLSTSVKGALIIPNKAPTVFHSSQGAPKSSGTLKNNSWPVKDPPQKGNDTWGNPREL